MFCFLRVIPVFVYFDPSQSRASTLRDNSDGIIRRGAAIDTLYYLQLDFIQSFDHVAEPANLRFIFVDSMNGQTAHQKCRDAAADHHSDNKPKDFHYNLIPSVADSLWRPANLISKSIKVSSVDLS